MCQCSDVILVGWMRNNTLCSWLTCQVEYHGRTQSVAFNINKQVETTALSYQFSLKIDFSHLQNLHHLVLFITVPTTEPNFLLPTVVPTPSRVTHKFLFLSGSTWFATVSYRDSAVRMCMIIHKENSQKHNIKIYSTDKTTPTLTWSW